MKHLLTSTILIAFAVVLAGLEVGAVYIYLTGPVEFAIDSGLELAYDIVIIHVVLVLVTIAWLRSIKGH